MPVNKSFSRSAWKTAKPDYHNKHKIKFPQAVRDIIKTSDIILEILDARAIEKTRNLEIEKLIKNSGKKLIRVINKVDLIDINELKKNKEMSELEPYVLFSVKKKIGRAKLQEMIKIEVKRVKIQFPRARVGIIGYPNTGKSSLINSIVGGKKASTSSERGHTKAIHEIKFTKNIVLLDTPGVIPDSEDSNVNVSNLKKHVQISVITYDKVKDPDLIILELMRKYPGVLQKYYKIKTDDVEEFLDMLGKKLNFLKKGGAVNLDRTARVILKDVQEGKIKIQTV
jgi:ribosome biogenesis GTPase A